MTTSISNNGSVNAKFTVSVDTTMVTRNGVLDIPITVDGKSFTKKFTYSLALKGQDGADGLNTATVYLYQVASSKPAVPNGALTYTFATKTISGSYLGNWS